MCQTTECEEARKLKKHNEELIAYSENMQSKLDDERDKSQKLEQELKAKKESATYWMTQAFSAKELRNSDKAYTAQIVTQRDELQKENKKLRKEVEFQSSCREHWVRKYDEMLTKYNDTSRELSRLLSENEALEDEVVTLQAERLYAKSEDRRDAKDLRDEVRRLEEENEKLRLKTVPHPVLIAQENKKLKEYAGNQQEIIDANGVRIRDLREENGNLKKTIEALTDDLSLAENTNLELRKKCNRLSDQHETQRKCIQDYQAVLKRIEDIAKNEPV